MLSSVTRFDTLKINSPAERTDSATTEDKDEEKGKREEKKGLTSIRSSSIHRSFLFFFLFSFFILSVKSSIDRRFAARIFHT